MSNRLPFTKIIHNPAKPELVLANGQHFLVLNTSTGEVIKSYSADTKVENVTDYFRSMAFNKEGTLLASSGENKEICVWDTKDWSLKNSRPAYKRVNALKFDNDSSTVIAADKFGDVYSHSIESEVVSETKLSPIAGHVSMVTDMLLTPDDKYIITSDRDEHIRVSHYPNGYNIESFCLGHTDVVTAIAIVPWVPATLVSSGGDGTVRLWKYVQGECIQLIDLKAHIEPYKPTAADANSEDAIVSSISLDEKNKFLAVAFAKSPAVIVLSWNEERKEFAFEKTVVTDSPILDIAFDLDGKLWVVSDSEKDLVSVLSEKEFKPMDGELVQKINGEEICKTDKIPDLYTIFGLRKFLDLPDSVNANNGVEGTKNKKRKTN